MVEIVVKVGGKLNGEALASLGLRRARSAKEVTIRAGLQVEVEEDYSRAANPGLEALELKVASGGHAVVYLALNGDPPRPAEYQLVRVEEHDQNGLRGGIGFVIRAPEE